MAGEIKFGYREIKEIILQRLSDGTWPSGSFLPNETALAEEFGCARATVNRALRELADDGLLDRKRKTGTKVSQRSSRKANLEILFTRLEIEAKGAAYRYHLLSREIIEAPLWLCGRIGLVKQEQMLHLRCMHYADNHPFQFEERWINLKVVPSAEKESYQKTPPSEWLVQEKPFTDIEFTYSACGADETQSKYLGILPNQAIFLGERTTWLEGKPVTYVRLSFAPGYKMPVFTSNYHL